MNDLNNELRSALLFDLSDAKTKVVSQDPFMLAHTPHFLGYDRHGMESSKPKLSAYNNAGIF